MTVRINLGCGTRTKPGWINTDRYHGVGIDQVFDLDEELWPFLDGTADEIEAFDVYEHVADPLMFMAECWRILRPSGQLYLHTAYYRNVNSFRDPTHRRFLTEESFDYWFPGTELNTRYGPAYTGGMHFRKIGLWLDSPIGDINVRMAKIGKAGWGGDGQVQA